jgi:hypothetical protein
MRTYIVRKIVTETFDYQIRAESDRDARYLVELSNKGEVVHIGKPNVGFVVLTPDEEPEV